MPKVSVIVPVYNTEKYMRRCLESILSQTYTDFEVILVDDGSIDKSGEICDEYARQDNRLRVYHKENGGASSARNIGLEKAKGKWITFIDSDDAIEQDYFKILECDKVELLIQKWRFASERETREPLVEGLYNDKLFITFMEKNAHKDIMRMVAAKFLLRDIIDQNNIRFNTKIRLGEDTLFMQEYYSYIHSLAVCNSSCYIYYRSDAWGEVKYKLDKSEFKLFFQEFNHTYKKLPYKNSKVYFFLYNFLLRMLSDKNSLKSRIFVRTIPECLELEKMTSYHITWKWYIKRVLSLFNTFIN